MGGASGSTAKATCTMHTCELAMSHRSLHQSNQQRRAGPGWKLTMDNADEQEESEDQPEELRRVLEARQPTAAGEAEAFSNESCCVRTLERGVCKSERNRSTA